MELKNVIKETAIVAVVIAGVKGYGYIKYCQGIVHEKRRARGEKDPDLKEFVADCLGKGLI